MGHFVLQIRPPFYLHVILAVSEQSPISIPVLSKSVDPKL